MSNTMICAFLGNGIVSFRFKDGVNYATNSKKGNSYKRIVKEDCSGHNYINFNHQKWRVWDCRGEL